MTTYNTREIQPYDGSTQVFSIGYDYRHREDVRLQISYEEDEATTYSDYVLDTDFTIEDSQLTLVTTPPIGAILDIYRVTKNDEREVKFSNGEVYIHELENDSDQHFKCVQEAIDWSHYAIDMAKATSSSAITAITTADEAKALAENADITSRLASGNATIALTAAKNADAKADEAVAEVAQAVEDVEHAVDQVTDKVDRDGTNVDRLPFLSSLGISPDGSVDFSDFAFTSGSNIDVAAYRFGLGIDELDNKVGVLEGSVANTSGSNIDIAAYSEKLGLDDLANTSGSNVDVTAYKAALAPRVVASLAGVVGNYTGEQVLRISGVVDDPEDDLYFWDGNNWCKEGV